MITDKSFSDEGGTADQCKDLICRNAGDRGVVSPQVAQTPPCRLATRCSILGLVKASD